MTVNSFEFYLGSIWIKMTVNWCVLLKTSYTLHRQFPMDISSCLGGDFGQLQSSGARFSKPSQAMRSVADPSQRLKCLSRSCHTSATDRKVPNFPRAKWPTRKPHAASFIMVALLRQRGSGDGFDRRSQILPVIDRKSIAYRQYLWRLWETRPWSLPIGSQQVPRLVVESPWLKSGQCVVGLTIPSWMMYACSEWS